MLITGGAENCLTNAKENCLPFKFRSRFFTIIVTVAVYFTIVYQNLQVPVNLQGDA